MWGAQGLPVLTLLLRQAEGAEGTAHEPAMQVNTCAAPECCS